MRKVAFGSSAGLPNSTRQSSRQEATNDNDQIKYGPPKSEWNRLAVFMVSVLTNDAAASESQHERVQSTSNSPRDQTVNKVLSNHHLKTMFFKDMARNFIAVK